MHEGTFLNSLRAVRIDGGPAMRVMALLGVLVTGAWLGWFLLAKVTVFESSDRSQLEVSSAAQPVEAAVAGQVVSSALTLGRQVKAGEMLVELDSTALRLQLAEEQARLHSLDAREQVLEEAIDTARSSASGAVRRSMLDRDAARAENERTRLQAQLADEEAQRVDRLLARGVVSKAEADRLLSQARQTQASAEAQRLTSERATLDIRARADAQRERRLRIEEELASLRGERQVRTTTVRRLEYLISLHQIRALKDGTLGDISTLHVGETVKVGQAVASIVPRDELKVIAQFAPKAALGRVQVGQRARVHLDGFPWTQYGGLTATVSAVAAQARDGSVRVELTLPPEGGSRLPREHGLPGTVEVEVERTTPALLVLRASGRLLERPAEKPPTPALAHTP
jgi:membrane fusion protein (multidrug efflux system)